MITIVLPTYNNETTIQRAITSVLNQVYTDWQLIIVDDCSTDKTPEILKSYENDKIKIVRHNVNKGVGVSRKTGVDLAEGEFITFLDSDDILLPDFLKNSLIFQQQQDSDVVYSSITIMYNEKQGETYPQPEYIMEGHISPVLQINLKKKFLTGKLFRTSIMKKIKMSPNRIGEDVQTLFFACYEANKVRCTGYSGYLHLYREGSLLGVEKDHFFSHCKSSLCDLEMLDYVIEKDNKDAIHQMLSNAWLSHLYHKQELKKGTYKTNKETKKDWKILSVWFKNHKDLIDESLLATKGKYTPDVYKTLGLDYLL